MITNSASRFMSSHRSCKASCLYLTDANLACSFRYSKSWL